MFLFSFHSPFYDFQKQTTSYNAFGLIPDFILCKALWHTTLEEFYFFIQRLEK